jgi:uncharacterized protein YkwD
MAVLWIVAVLAFPATAGAESPERGILKEINLARTNPAGYANILRAFRHQFQGKLYHLPGSRALMRTSEGVPAVDKAIRSLSRQKPLRPLGWSDGLADAAGDLVDEQGATGATGHGARGTMRERVERHGRWEDQIAENIYYGSRDPRLVVMQLIIDDGVPDRGHRKSIYNPVFGTAGVACGTHPRYDGMCVIEFAGAFRE